MKPQIHSLSKDVKESLGFYVYLLLDPDTRKPFYIGKYFPKGAANPIQYVGFQE